MTQSLQAVGALLPTGYALCALMYGAVFAGERAQWVARPRVWVLRVTLLLHALYFGLRATAIDQSPVTDLWSTVSAVAFSTALLYSLVAFLTRNAGSGGIVFSLVFLLQLLSSGLGSFDPQPRPGPQGLWAAAHVGGSVLSAAALALSGLHGLLWLLLYREMRGRRFGALFGHLPNLDVLARMMRAAALFAFIGLTVGLNVGIALAHAEKLERFDYRHPEVLLSLLLWLCCGAIAFSTRIPRFSARRAAWAATAALAVLLVSLLLVLSPNPFHAGP